MNKPKKEITGKYFSSLKRKAKLRGFDFDLTIDDCYAQFIKQDKKCALTGIKLKHYVYENETRNTISGDASLDRIDSDKGYTKDNIQWVHKTINIMKMDLSETEFVRWCRRVVKYGKGR